MSRQDDGDNDDDGDNGDDADDDDDDADDDDEDDGDDGDDDAGDDDARKGGRVPRSCLVGGNQTIIVCAPTICQNIKLQLFSSPFYTTSRLYLLFPSLPFRYISVFCYIVELA